MTKENTVDLDSFDAVAQCAQGHEFELKNMDGHTGTGITLIVQGRHSTEVSKWNGALMRKLTTEAQMAQRKGKQPEPKTLDELQEQNIDGASVRVIGWKGVKQEFDRAKLKAALKRNPHWIDQIISESDDLGNFTKAPLVS